MEICGHRFCIKQPHHQCDLSAMVGGMVCQMLHQVRSPRPNVGNIRASGEETLESFRQASMTGRTEFN
jgi:hypothetical protein